MVVAFFILGEAVTAAALLGGAIILVGVWLVNKS
jgi:drug/metabolite transporter (DMT)-like permease